MVFSRSQMWIFTFFTFFTLQGVKFHAFRSFPFPGGNFHVFTVFTLAGMNFHGFHGFHLSHASAAETETRLGNLPTKCFHPWSHALPRCNPPLLPHVNCFRWLFAVDWPLLRSSVFFVFFFSSRCSRFVWFRVFRAFSGPLARFSWPLARFRVIFSCFRVFFRVVSPCSRFVWFSRYSYFFFAPSARFSWPLARFSCLFHAFAFFRIFSHSLRF